MAINPMTGLEEDLDPVTGLPVVQSPVAPVAPAQPNVREYLMQKYAMGDKYNDSARQAIVDQNKEDASGINWRAGLASLGAGIAGKDAASAGMSILNKQQAERDAKLNEFDKGAQKEKSDFAFNRDLTKADLEDKMIADSKDPTSARSKSAQDMLVQDFGMDPALAGKMSAEQIEARVPSLKAKIDRQMREREFSEKQKDRNLQREMMNSNRMDARAEKHAQQAKPSDKQIEAFTDIDNAASDLNNLLASLGDKSGWTGPTDGRIPDFLVGDDQVAWRSAVGKYKDAYRKAITGAGAGPTEIAMLEKRLPSETDTLANFQAKSQEALKELERRRVTLQSNLEKGGKDVSKFKSESPMQSKEETKVVDGVTYKKVPGGWEEVE